ncbi:hypothetical protein BJV78DRAFT_1220125 [Lactifluus subvellereus]|nr:hypothetical protein BJV78DRAFT_1220125 [Lactifluus subvellereus]
MARSSPRYIVHDHHHHHRSQSSHGHSRSHSYGRSHSGHGGPSVTPAPPLLVSREYHLRVSYRPEPDANTENSEPIAPYLMVPATSYTASEYQPQYAAQPGHGHALAPPVASVLVPLPSPAPALVLCGISSPLAASISMPVQTCALHISQISRLRACQPLLSQEVDAPPCRDWMDTSECLIR